MISKTVYVSDKKIEAWDIDAVEPDFDLLAIVQDFNSVSVSDRNHFACPCIKAHALEKEYESEGEYPKFHRMFIMGREKDVL